MKFSTKGRYGLKAMLDLAVHNNEGQVVLKSIAERQGLSENYLEQLFAVLKNNGWRYSKAIGRPACFGRLCCRKWRNMQQ